VIVPQTVTLGKLHTVLQAAMGWTDRAREKAGALTHYRCR
jgi:hypothetical protein